MKYHKRYKKILVFENKRAEKIYSLIYTILAILSSFLVGSVFLLRFLPKELIEKWDIYIVYAYSAIGILSAFLVVLSIVLKRKYAYHKRTRFY